ncbi:MAG TPA: hypothetical protein VMC41_01840 [Candidatus Nanoarchaeia archaeon]|nr:hypothetical protein [Candidatus Nanoarchaeia archaeon]
MSSYAEGQIHQAADAFESIGLTPEEVTKIIQGKAHLRSFLDVLDGRAEIRSITTTEEKIAYTIIRVNRSVSPAYPDWVKEVLHKDLELSGPNNYDIGVVKQWYHPDQESGVVEGKVIYNYLKDNDMIKDQLGLADLLAIQAKGIAFFRKYFSGKAVFGWKSVVRGGSDCLCVPCLIEDGDRVIVCWYQLDFAWVPSGPSLHFASK